MGYPKRQLVKIVEEICKEDNIEYASFSDNYIIQLSKNGKNTMIYNYKFANNDAAISKICDDKAGLSEVLKYNNIPHIPHLYFEDSSSPMVGKEGIWGTLTKMLKDNGKLVVKTNTGSGGTGVYKCENQKELESAVFDILGRKHSLTISPFIDIENEYRTIIVDDKAMLVYAKQRPNVVGNGVDSLEKLIKDANFEDVEISEKLDLKYVPKEKEKVTVSWKHNLGQGSLPVLVKDKKEIEKLTNFALKTASILGLKFASVDIVKDKEGIYRILEINSGIMMENFSRLSKENYEMAKHIYRTAIYKNLNLELKKNEEKTIYENFNKSLAFKR